MKLDKVSMKSGNYFRVLIENAREEWWDAVVRAGGFTDKEELFATGYRGNIEIAGYYDGTEITGVSATYYFDYYEDIQVDITQEELAMVENFVKEQWDGLPDNEEYCLGDSEWQEMAYGS